MMPIEYLCVLVFVHIISSCSCLPAGEHSGSSVNFSLGGSFSNLAVNGLKNHNKADQIAQFKTLILPEPFPDSGRKEAVKEQENFLSKKDSGYGYLQQFVAGFTNPKPIIDTIREEEKYGNDGDKFRTFGTAIVGGFESLSNFLNGIVELPFELVKQATRKASSTLNSIGLKLVGL